MLKAALIDLDGLLVNSEALYLEANKIYFKKHNFKFTLELHRQGTGQKFEKWIKSIYSSHKTGEEILAERNAVFFEIVRQKIKLLKGAENTLSMLRSYYNTALVTSSKRNYVDLIFEKTQIDKYFDLIITGDMVNVGKPDPQCYLLAAKKLGVKTSECIVLEDAPSGVLAGKNAGMKVIAIPSRYVIGDESFHKADIVLKNIQKVTKEKLNSLSEI